MRGRYDNLIVDETLQVRGSAEIDNLGVNGTFAVNGSAALGDSAADLVTLNGQVDLDSAAATLSTNAATITKWAARITSEALTTAGVTDVAFVITKTGVVAGDLAIAVLIGGTNTQGSPIIKKVVCTTDTVTITLQNAHATEALNGTIMIGLWILKQ